MNCQNLRNLSNTTNSCHDFFSTSSLLPSAFSWMTCGSSTSGHIVRLQSERTQCNHTFCNDAFLTLPTCEPPVAQQK